MVKFSALLLTAFMLTGCLGRDAEFVQPPVIVCEVDEELTLRPKMPRPEGPGANAHARWDAEIIEWGVEGWRKHQAIVELCTK